MIQPTLHTIHRLASTFSQKHKAKATILLNRVTPLLIRWFLEALYGRTRILKPKEQFNNLSWSQTTSSRRTHRKPDTTVLPLFRHLYLVSMISWTHVMLSRLWTCQASTPILIFATLPVFSTESAYVWTGAQYSRDWRSLSPPRILPDLRLRTSTYGLGRGHHSVRGYHQLLPKTEQRTASVIYRVRYDTRTC
jgi:hypothetical protein